jgi:hypothetical protein
MTKLIQLWTQFIEAFSLLLPLKWNNRNMCQIKNHVAPLCNFFHAYVDVSTDFDVLCTPRKC